MKHREGQFKFGSRDGSTVWNKNKEVACKIKADGALSSTVLISTSQTSAIFWEQIYSHCVFRLVDSHF